MKLSPEWDPETTTPRERYERFARMNEEASRRVQAHLDELAVLNGELLESGETAPPSAGTPAPDRSRSRSGRGRLRRALARARRARR
jgi:hypothetical protein